MTDFLLNPENVRHLLPSDIFDELFPESDFPLSPENIKHLLPSDIFYELFPESDFPENVEYLLPLDIFDGLFSEITPLKEKNQENVEHLLPLDILDGLFSESTPLKESQSQLDSGNTNNVNGPGDGITVQAANGIDTSIHVIPNNQVFISYFHLLLTLLLVDALKVKLNQFCRRFLSHNFRLINN